MTLNELQQEAKRISGIIQKHQKQLDTITDQIKSLLPKGYWYTYDIDASWNWPKKYSVRKVECSPHGIYVTVKEVFKKKPWPSFTGESNYDLDSFLKLNIYKTEQEATYAYQHRICPKCGGFMVYSKKAWCSACMQDRQFAAWKFEQSHKFYNPKNKQHYHVEYEDELTTNNHRGFEGRRFKLRRLDTGAVIDTCNLWSDGYGDNVDGLPEIEFLPLEEK